MPFKCSSYEVIKTGMSQVKVGFLNSQKRDPSYVLDKNSVSRRDGVTCGLGLFTLEYKNFVFR